MDRRFSARVPMDVWVREERGDFFFLYRCTNISEHGMFLSGRKIDAYSYMPQPQSKFYIPLPPMKEVIALKGRTLWQHVDHTSGQIVGSAIIFDFAPLRFLYAIRKLQKQFDEENNLLLTHP